VVTALEEAAPGHRVPGSHAAHASHSVVVALLRAVVVVAVYWVYDWARDTHGSATTGALSAAQLHAGRIEQLQSALRLPPERDVQAAVLPAEWFVRGCGAFYGTAHFAVTLGVLLLVLVRRPHRFVREGVVLAVATFAAVGVFALYPVAPPRLMPAGQATVDTLATVGGVWSYDHSVLERITDPFAAMPSLHLGWATWCAVVVWRGTRTRRHWRVVAVVYPLLTLVAVLVTGNHWYLDAVCGTLLVLLVAAGQVRLERVLAAGCGRGGRPARAAVSRSGARSSPDAA
jgi:hypothetical protein